MNDAPRQTLRALVARHGTGLCSDARRCEALLRDHAGAHRREVNILVSALKERVPLDLLAARSAMPRGLLLTRLAKRLEDHLALTAEAARWAVDSWALALGVLTAAEVSEREKEAREDSDRKAAPPSSTAAPRPAVEEDDEERKSRAAQSRTAQTTRPAPPPQRQQHPPVTQPPPSATTHAPRTSTTPPSVARPASRQTSSQTSTPRAPQPSPPTFAGAAASPSGRQATGPQANANSPTTGALPSPAQDASRGGRRWTLRGCTVGCLLIVLLTLALVVGGPFVFSVLREEQQRRNLEPSPVLSP